MGYLDNEEELDPSELQDVQDQQDLLNLQSSIEPQPAPQSDLPPADLASIMRDRQEPAPMAPVKPSTSPLDELKRAQDSERNQLLFANLGRAVDTAASGIGQPGKQNDQSFYSDLAKQAHAPVQNVLDSAKYSKSSDLAEFRKRLLENADKRLKQSDARADRDSRRLGIQEGRFGLQQDKTAAGAAKDIMDSPLIQKGLAQRQQLDIDMHTIENADTITPELWGELQLGLANSLAGGRAAAQGTIHAVTIKNLDTDIARFKQYINSHPEDIGSPDSKKFLLNTFKRLDEAYGQAIEKQAEQRGIGKEYANTPQAKKAKESAISGLKYKPREEKFDTQTEVRVNKFMRDNNLKRDEAVKILRDKNFIK